MPFKRILAGAAVVIASLVSAGAARPAFAAAAPAAGSLDTSFGTGGKVVTSLGTPATFGSGPSDAALAPDGDIVVGGGFGLVRYLPNGTLDTSFGRHGLVTTGFSVNALNIQPNGDIVAVANAGGSGVSTGFQVARFTTSGAPDPTFGAGGVVTTAFPQATDGAFPASVLVEPDGNILVGGGATSGSPTKGLLDTQAALAQYNPDGTPDQAFGSGGTVVSSNTGGPAATLGVDAAGDIFTGGGAEFSPAGNPAATAAAPATLVATSAGGTGSQALMPDGQLAAATSVGISRGNTDVQVKLFNANGTVDTAFRNPPFTFTGAVFGGHQNPAAVAVQSNGQIVILGTDETTGVLGLARLGTNGTLDTAFGTGGVLTTSFPNGAQGVAVLIQPGNGDIIAVGQTQSSAGDTELALARYTG